MERKSLNQVPIQVRDTFNRAAKTSASLDVDSAIEIIKDIVKKYPYLGPARDRLRELEKRKMATGGFGAKLGAQLATMFKLPVIKAKTSRDPIAAMGMCEDLIAKCLDNPAALNALADAAEAADAPFIAAEALLIAHEFHPKNETNMRRLITALQNNNQAREGLTLFRELAARHPNDLNVQSELRAAMALASMERGKWEDEGGNTQQKAADAKQQITQQLMEGTIHDANQANALIESFTQELAKNDSTDIRRKLADAYMFVGSYEAAIEQLKTVAKMTGAFDAVTDKSIEKAQVALYAQMIDELRKNPGSYDQPEAQIAQLEKEIVSYKLRHAKERSRVFPNDAILHFEYAEQLFERGDIEGALVEFQQAARSPQKRIACLIYLGRCFAAKEQYDIAVEQFDAALKDMVRMDNEKLQTLYYLGNALEKAGKNERALECYKDIYQNQANYLDVAERIQKFYAEKK